MPVHPFDLDESAFAAGHDRRFICPSRKRDESLAMLRKGITDGAPFIMVTGDPGIGKTSVVWEALGAPALMAKVAFLTHPSPQRTDLLEAIAVQFGVAMPIPPARNEAVARLEQHLRELRSRGRPAVLVLDDAHGIKAELLEEVRSLSDWRAEGRELLQIVLVGLPELERRLARPGLERLREQIALHCRIVPFTAEETERYLHRRVTVAGGNGPAVFPSGTCQEIHQYTYGFPRDINMLAGRALDRALGEKSSNVTPDHVRAAVAAARLRGETTAPRPAEDVGSFAPTPAETDPAAAGPAEDLPSFAPGRAEPEPAAPGPLPAARAAPATPEPGGTGEALILPEDDSIMRQWVARSSERDRRRRLGLTADADPTSPRPVPRPRKPQRSARGIEPDVASPETASGAWRSGAERHDPPPGPPSRPRSESVLQLVLAAVVVSGLLTAVLLLMRTWDLDKRPSHGPRPITATPRATGTVRATPAVERPTATSPSEAPQPAPAPPETPVRAALPPDVQTPPPAPPSTRPQGEDVAPTSSTVAVPPPLPGTAFGLEVASYIDRERAAAESQRMAGATGQPCRVVTDIATDTYTVVLGAFDSRWAAERAGDDLLGRGLVRQARVVTFAGETETP